MATASHEIDGPFNALVTTILKPDVKHGGFNKKVVCACSEDETQSLIAQHGVVDLIGIHINPATGAEYPMDNPTGGTITIVQKDSDGTATTGEIILSFRYDLPDKPYKLRIRYTPGESAITTDVYVHATAQRLGTTYDGEGKIKVPSTPEYLEQLFRICDEQRRDNCFHEEYYTYSEGTYITLPQSQER